MNFSFKNEGTWFYFNEDDQSKGGIKVRITLEQDLDKIYKVTRKTVNKFKHGQRFEDVKIDNAKEDRLIYDHCIVEWDNVTVDGKELECNAENKYNLVKKSLSFRMFFNTCIETVTSDFDVLNEEEIAKN